MKNFVPLNLWHRLTRPASTEVDEMYQEYIARVVLTIITITACVLTLVTFVGLILRSVERRDFGIILLIDLISFCGIFLIFRGRWKLASILPVGMFMSLGFYSVWTGSFTYTGVLATVTSLLLIGLLGSPRATVYYIVWIVIADNLLQILNGRIAADNLFSGIVSLLFMYAGIAFLQWLGINQLRISLKKSVDLGHDLQREIENHQVTHGEKLKLFDEYQFLFQNIQNDVFRLRKTDDGVIRLQIFEGVIANRFQLTTDRIAGKPLSQVLSADSYEAIIHPIERAFCGEHVYFNGLIAKSYFTVVLTPVWVGQKVSEVVGSLFDTTSATLLEKESDLFKQKMHLFMDQNPMGVLELDQAGKIITWNAAAEKIFGYPAEDIVDRSDIEKLILPKSRRKFRRFIEKVKTKHQSDRAEFECQTREGNSLLCEWIFNPLFAEGSQLDGIIILVQDITEQHLSDSLQLAIFKISSSASRAQTLEELYDSVHSIIGELMNAQNFFIALYDSARNGFEFVYHRDDIDENPQFVPSGKGLIDLILRTGEPALVDPARFDELAELGEVENRGTPSVDWLGVPLKDEFNQTFGVIVLQTYSEGERYTQKHLDILTFVSTQISQVVLKNRVLDRLRESEEKYHNFIELTNDAVILANEDGIIIDANQSLEKLSGLSRQDILGLYAWDLQYKLLPPDKKNRVSYESLKKMFLKKVFTREEKDLDMVFNIQVQRADQTRRFVQESLFSFTAGKRYHVGVIARDITQLKETEENLRKSEERYRNFLENQGEGSTFVDTQENFTYANPAAESMFGVPPGQLVGRNFKEFLSADQLKIVLDQTQLRIRGQKTTYELEITLLNGEKKTLLITATPQLTPAGQYLGAFSLFRDITERKTNEEQLKYYSMHDSLTKIHNRAYFDTESVRIASSGILPVSVIVIDLDDLKKVNDRQGHQMGDKLLIEAAALLKSCIRKTDLIARIGGDEFVIMLMEASKADAARVKRKILDRLAKHNLTHPDFQINLSMGISVAEEKFDQAALVKLADERMLREKNKKKMAQFRDERGGS